MVKRGLVCMAILGLGLGCSPKDEVAITETRSVESPQVDLSVQGRDRFGIQSMPAAMGAKAETFAYELPPGWHEEAPTDLRVVNLHVGSDHAVDCYVSTLRGDGGGIEANLNRWRRQMGQEPLSADEIAALPSLPILGADAAYISIPGTYGGMQGDTQIDDALMLGAMAVAGNRAVFVKMVGPAEQVEAEREHFEAFCRSLQPASTTTAQRTVQGSAAGGTVSPANAAPFDPAALSWTVPDHWKRGRESSMRLMTYVAGPNGEAECAVSVFPGDVGGLEANVNRWRQQMGLDALPSGAASDLPTVDVLDRASTLVELEGTYSGMGDTALPDYGLLGVIVPLPSHTLFFKLTGPAPVVAQEKEHFLSFVRSFEQ